MNIKKLLFIVFIILTASLGAQSYQLTTSTGAYSNISNGTSLNGTSTWDDPEYLIPIGFDFQFFNTTINEIYINDYGLGGELTPGSSDIGTSSVLIPYTADIADRAYDDNNPDAPTGSLSSISYVLEGTSGNRILKIEWNNVGFLSEILQDNISTDFTNFQLWLYEDSNVIEVHFGPNSISQPELAFDGDTGASISLVSEVNLDSGEVTGTALTLSGDPMNPTVTNSNPYAYEDFFNGVIPNGMVYKFTPSALNVTEIETKLQYKPYPIPANDFLHIPGIAGQQEYTIFNVLGSAIDKGKMEGNSRIHVENYPKGVYFIQFSENELIKFVKK